MSIESAVDPEEAFVVSLASCHMLWFLDYACRDGLVVDRYIDHAVGQMGRDDAGRLAILRVTLKPEVVFSTESHPETEKIRALHHAAHESCFIANSVKTEVICEPVFPTS